MCRWVTSLGGKRRLRGAPTGRPERPGRKRNSVLLSATGRPNRVQEGFDLLDHHRLLIWTELLPMFPERLEGSSDRRVAAIGFAPLLVSGIPHVRASSVTLFRSTPGPTRGALFPPEASCCAMPSASKRVLRFDHVFQQIICKLSRLAAAIPVAHHHGQGKANDEDQHHECGIAHAYSVINLPSGNKRLSLGRGLGQNLPVESRTPRDYDDENLRRPRPS